MGKSKPPKPPDPFATATAQAKLNRSTAGLEQLMNMTDQEGPDGSLTYSQTGTRDFYDPFTGKLTQVPAYKATTALSDAQARIKSETDAAEFNLANAAKLLSGELDTKPFALDDKVDDEIYRLGSARVAPRFEEARRRAETAASVRGYAPGSDAYTALMREVGERENDAWNELALTGRDQAFRQAVEKYNLPLNRITALLSGSQVAGPNFVSTPATQVANTDYASLVNQDYANRLGQWQQKNQSFNEALGGLFGLAGNVVRYSDQRLKRDVKKVGETNDGQNIYAYRYKGGRPMHLGLMAQEVERRKPQAVARDRCGFRVVDYARALEDA